MVVGSVSRGCQVVVVGAGPGGYVAAIRLAQLGKDVILVEKAAKSLGGSLPQRGLYSFQGASFMLRIWPIEAQHSDREWV